MCTLGSLKLAAKLSGKSPSTPVLSAAERIAAQEGSTAAEQRAAQIAESNAKQISYAKFGSTVGAVTGM